MLKVVTGIDDWVTEIIKDDPVRPNLSAEFRVNENAEIFAYWEETTLGAVCCVRYTKGIPEGINEMQEASSIDGDTAVFYTIWSYAKGSGRSLINEASKEIKARYPKIKNLVTLSPQTEMAEKFHLRNGAWKYRDNYDTVNFAYEID